MRWLILDRHLVRYISADFQGRHDATSSASLLHVPRQDTANRVVSTGWKFLPPSNEKGPDRSSSESSMQACGIMTEQHGCHYGSPRDLPARGKQDRWTVQTEQRERRPGDGAPSCTHPIAPPPCLLPRCCCVTRMRGPFHRLLNPPCRQLAASQELPGRQAGRAHSSGQRRCGATAPRERMDTTREVGCLGWGVVKDIFHGTPSSGGGGPSTLCNIPEGESMPSLSGKAAII